MDIDAMISEIFTGAREPLYCKGYFDARRADIDLDHISNDSYQAGYKQGEKDFGTAKAPEEQTEASEAVRQEILSWL